MSFSIRRLMCANCLLLTAVIGLSSQAGCRVLRGRGLTKDPTIARELSLQGADALEQHKYSEAETMFAEAVRLSPNDERAHWGLAEVQWQRGERPSATSHMAEAVRLSGGSPDLQVRLGRMFFDQQDYHNALQQSDAAAQMQGAMMPRHGRLGGCAAHAGRSRTALDCYHRALIHRPDWPEIEVAVAEMYQAMNRPEQALATLDRLSDQHGAGHVPRELGALRGCRQAAME
ncbi:MAG: tetratricopeptide repeat protein [Pirellulales bacterium]